MPNTCRNLIHEQRRRSITAARMKVERCPLRAVVVRNVPPTPKAQPTTPTPNMTHAGPECTAKGRLRHQAPHKRPTHQAYFLACDAILARIGSLFVAALLLLVDGRLAMVAAKRHQSRRSGWTKVNEQRKVVGQRICFSSHCRPRLDVFSLFFVGGKLPWPATSERLHSSVFLSRVGGPPLNLWVCVFQNGCRICDGQGLQDQLAFGPSSFAAASDSRRKT